MDKIRDFMHEAHRVASQLGVIIPHFNSKIYMSLFTFIILFDIIRLNYGYISY